MSILLGFKNEADPDIYDNLLNQTYRKIRLNNEYITIKKLDFYYYIFSIQIGW